MSCRPCRRKPRFLGSPFPETEGRSTYQAATPTLFIATHGKTASRQSIARSSWPNTKPERLARGIRQGLLFHDVETTCMLRKPKRHLGNRRSGHLTSGWKISHRSLSVCCRSRLERQSLRSEEHTSELQSLTN